MNQIELANKLKRDRLASIRGHSEGLTTSPTLKPSVPGTSPGASTEGNLPPQPPEGNS